MGASGSWAHVDKAVRMKLGGHLSASTIARDIIFHHIDIGGSRSVRGAERMGIQVGDDLDTRLGSDLVGQLRIGAGLQENRRRAGGTDLIDQSCQFLRRGGCAAGNTRDDCSDNW